MAFKDIAGNSRVKKIIKLALERRRVPNSMLFCGPDGVGKRKTALVLAKALNCLRKTEDSCDECDSCRAIDKGNFPDVMDIVPTGEVVKIDQIRFMKQIAYLRPMSGKKRFFIIQEADKLQDEGSNALLKVLEEPPLFSHIVLITDKPALILSTIKSRCRTLNFLPVATEEIEQALRGRGFEDEKAKITALLVHGNLDQALILDWEAVQQKRQDAWALFRAMIAKDGSSAFLKKFAFSRRNLIKEDLEETLELFSSFCRDMILLKEGGEAKYLFNPDYERPIREGAKYLNIDQAFKLLGLIHFAVSSLNRNLNVSLLTSSLYSQMIGSFNV